MNKTFFIQVAKYGVVGVMNTLLTILVIWIMLRFAFGVKDDVDASPWAMSISNILGYAAGLINSFIFNRNWTFKSKTNWKTGFLKFFLAFGVCYILQLGVVLFLNQYTNIPSIDFQLFGKPYIFTAAYICQLSGIITYTFLNFLCNKYYTFKS